jgi:hypothetical protein
MSYRTENGDAILDVRVSTLDRLFDNRDPAPFRERDLDPDLVEYLVDSARDIGTSQRMRIVFWIAEPCPPEEVKAAVQTHFDYEIDRATRLRREHRRTGWVALLIAAIAVVGLTGLGGFVANAIDGTLGAGLREALLISGWVLMWRPIEVLVYDGIPFRRERGILRALREAAIEVRAK